MDTLLYDVAGPVATITLNRPDRLNTIVPPMPDEFEAAIERATLDPGVKVIVLRGAGRAFCAGYDFAGGFHHWDEALTTDGRWDPGKDFALAASPYGPTQKFMSMWRTPKPVIAQVHGWCVGGGSDMALCADLIIAAEDAQIGTPYSRVWGCYLSGMWLYRLGLTKAKEHALTGKPLSGREAAEIELINAAVPFDQLESAVAEQARATRGDPILPAGRDEADRQPGLREHGTARHPDARPDPGRPDAQHAGGPGLRRALGRRRRTRGHAAARRPVRRLQCGRAGRPARPGARDQPAPYMTGTSASARTGAMKRDHTGSMCAMFRKTSRLATIAGHVVEAQNHGVGSTQATCSRCASTRSSSFTPGSRIAALRLVSHGCTFDTVQ